MSAFTVRPGRPDELEQVAAYAIEGMRAELYGGIRLDPAKVRAVVAHLLAGGAGFQQVAVDDAGRVVGIVAAAEVPMLFFERSEAVVIACRATLPGAGRALLASLKAWADASFSVRRVVWPIEFHAPAATVRLARAAGFTQVSNTCTYEKD